MGYKTKANDWEVASVGSLAGGTGLAGGVFLFLFKSRSADISLGCRFYGLGIGAGFDLGKIGKSIKLIAKVPTLKKLFEVASYAAAAPDISFVPVNVKAPFSMHELHNNFGALSTGGVAPVYGYTLTKITCTSGIFSRYFVNQPCHGWGYGFGAAALYTYGFWFNSKI